MKFIGRVSLFCIIGILGFVMGIYTNQLYQQWFYPNRGKEPEKVIYTAEKEVESKSEKMSESLPADNRQEAVITCDTAFVIEEYDKNTDITATHEEEVPGKYMGMNRAAFVDAMMSYEMSPPLDEQKRGLVSVDVLSFSEDRILLRKIYEIVPEEEEKIFYLVAEDHYITVYMEDMKNIYLYTDIHLEDLPIELQEEIIQKKLIQGENNLFHFLESYSS